jgi:NADH-quinone oxidoreductase subunit J
MQNQLIQIVFYVFAAITVLAALMVITQNNPVRCVLFLVLVFFTSSVLWLLLSAEFLALILVLVYVGAVMTLFLFVVMMLNIDTESTKTNFTKYLPFSLILVALLVGLLMKALPLEWATSAIKNVTQSSLSNTEQIGIALYTDYILAFEMAAILLLVAIIAAITLVHQGAIRSKRQDIVKQIMTRSKDRVTLLNPKAEK